MAPPVEPPATPGPSTRTRAIKESQKLKANRAAAAVVAAAVAGKKRKKKAPTEAPVDAVKAKAGVKRRKGKEPAAAQRDNTDDELLDASMGPDVDQDSESSDDSRLPRPEPPDYFYCLQ